MVGVTRGDLAFAAAIDAARARAASALQKTCTRAGSINAPARSAMYNRRECSVHRRLHFLSSREEARRFTHFFRSKERGSPHNPRACHR